MKSYRLVTRISAIALLSLASIGCGKGIDEKRVETVPVKGKLLVDGKPFGPAFLMLNLSPPNPQLPAVNGAVKQDGSFELGTYEQGDGAPVGSYQVTLAPNPSAMGPVPQVKPFTLEVKKGETAADHELKLESTGKTSTGLVPPGGRR